MYASHCISTFAHISAKARVRSGQGGDQLKALNEPDRIVALKAKCEQSAQDSIQLNVEPRQKAKLVMLLPKS
jgi:hypothetical protein